LDTWGCGFKLKITNNLRKYGICGGFLFAESPVRLELMPQGSLQKRYSKSRFIAQNGEIVNVAHSIGAEENSKEKSVVDDDSKCPVSGKRKYGTEGEALATAAHQIATTNAPKELRAYLCSWCEAWHLTKDASKAGKRRK
jgi:hypothetical protein